MTSSDLVVLEYFALCTNAGPAEIGTVLCMAAGAVRPRLAGLEYQRLVVGRHDDSLVPRARVFTVTSESRQKTGPI